MRDYEQFLSVLKYRGSLFKIPENYFKIFYGIEKENPIEIPPILRTEEFLKRKYSITSYDKIPSKGQYFIKDVSKLKVFSYDGDMRFFVQTDEKYKSKYSLTLNSTHLYQVSEHVNILSEYRIFVLDNEIYSINNYDGDVCLGGAIIDEVYKDGKKLQL